MHLHHCRCFQEHVRMLLQSLRALCKAPGGAGSIWKYLEALARATGVSGRFAYGFRTELHFADVLGFPPAAVAEEVLPRLGHCPSTPAAFVVISVGEPFQVDSSGRMPRLESVEPGGQ